MIFFIFLSISLEGKLGFEVFTYDYFFSNILQLNFRLFVSLIRMNFKQIFEYLLFPTRRTRLTIIWRLRKYWLSTLSWAATFLSILCLSLCLSRVHKPPLSLFPSPSSFEIKCLLQINITSMCRHLLGVVTSLNSGYSYSWYGIS